MEEIDVSKCDYFNSKTKKCRIPHYADGIKFVSCNCDETHNCYYKQLQQLKQENEELRKINKANADSYFKYQNEWKQENEDLKEKLKQADEDIKGECLRCATTNFLEQKLDKIREIAQGMHDLWYNETQSPYADVYKLAEHLLGCELNRILNEFKSEE